MRDLFNHYYPPSDDFFTHLWREATFVFDTNVLLNLYRYTSQTRDDLIRVLEQLQQRIWFPHQVGLEFSRNRISVIEEQNQIMHLIEDFDKFVEDKFAKPIKQSVGKRGHFFADLDKISAIFQKTKQELKEELDRTRAEHPDPRTKDTLIERLDRIVQGRIGIPYSPEEMKKLAVEFEDRYKRSIPPGYKDASKKDMHFDDDPSNPANKYGDVIVWYQIIGYAQPEKKPIILVVDDKKEDWWEIRRGEKQGPKAGLRWEFQEKVGASFYMYTADVFLQRAKDFLQLQAQEATIQEIRESREQSARFRAVSSSYPFSPLLNAGLLRQIAAVNQTINLLGGVEYLQQQYKLYYDLHRFMRGTGLIPTSETTTLDNSERIESLQVEEDTPRPDSLPEISDNLDNDDLDNTEEREA